MKYLRQAAPGVHVLDHRLTPEVSAMLAAMASRMPAGGIEARYQQVVDAIKPDLWNECAPKERGRPDAYWTEKAEDRLCEYPLHPKVQDFFDQFVLNYGHCYDDQTEVLCQDASSGQIMWMFWEDVLRWHRSTLPDGSDEVRIRMAAFDPATDSVRFEEPSGWVAKLYQGQMYRVKKERGNIDLLVTPEHTMLVSKREYVGGGRANATYEWSDWHGIKAQDVAGKTTYRYKRGAARLADVREITEAEDPWGLSLVDLHAFGRLCGFFVGDGYAGGKQAGYLSFNIRKEREQTFLASIEADLGLKVQRDKRGRCHVHLKGARDWARRHFYHDTATIPSGKPAKDIPWWVLLAPEPFIRGFFDGLHHSDGSKVTDDSWSFANSSDPVIDKLQILGTLWGCPVSVRGPYQEGGSKVSFVSGPKCKEPVINRNREKREDGWEDYNGMVYCATVSTGFLVVRRNHATMISGNSSIMELTGQPAVYTEGISWYAAYLLFDSPLCAGQEFSTRAVRHKDWPMARECFDAFPTIIGSPPEHILREMGYDPDTKNSDPWWGMEATPHPALKALHDGWFEVFEAEVAWWQEHLSDPENRAALGIADKEPFRPALDRARWAIPGTIATGCCHTGHFRERARILHDGLLLAQRCQNPVAEILWGDFRRGYEAALPGMAGMGLREAVYDETSRLPAHWTLQTETPRTEVWVRLHMNRDSLSPLIMDRPQDERSYLDPVFNRVGRVDISFQCSLAVSRDWHRHRTMFPWTLSIVRGKHADIARSTKEGIDNGLFFDDGIRIHPAYQPMSDLAKAKLPDLLKLTTETHDAFMAKGDQIRAMLSLPLGTHVQMSGQAGLRDAVYMLELREHAHGANFEYKAQAHEAMRQLKSQLKGTRIKNLPRRMGLE